MAKKQFNKKISAFLVAALMVVFIAIVAVSANALDTTRPTIISVSAVNNEQDVSRNEQITVVFSENMDPSTINENTFSVMQRTTPEFGVYRSVPVDGTVTYSGRTATFNSDDLSPDQRYGNVFTVMITTGAKDLAGNSLSQNYIWSYTTGSDAFNTGSSTSQQDQSAPAVSGSPNAQDTLHPTIISVSAANNEQDVSRNEQITVVFSENMDSSTINTNTFSVMQRTTPEFGGYRSIPVEGIVTYNGRTATFNSDDLSPDQRYGNVFTVMITTGAKDLAGNSLSQNYIWSYTTGSDAFNTGSSTSQQDQSAALVSGATTQQPIAAAAAPATGAVTSTQTVTQGKFPWGWVLGGLLFLLILAALVFAPGAKPANQKSKKSTQAKSTQARPSPFGDVHPVMALEGIGPEYKKRLQARGIKNTQQLWEADTVKVARQTGASLSSVKSWQEMAELASVHDIGPQYAELLERSGIHSIEQLKGYDTNELLRLVRKKQDSINMSIQGNIPGYALVNNWIEEARDHKFSVSEGQDA